MDGANELYDEGVCAAEILSACVPVVTYPKTHHDGNEKQRRNNAAQASIACQPSFWLCILALDILHFLLNLAAFSRVRGSQVKAIPHLEHALRTEGLLECWNRRGV